MKITSNAQCLFCQLWCFVRNMFLLRATISLSFFHPPLGNLNSTCALTMTSTDTNILACPDHVIQPDNRLRWWWSPVLIVRMPGWSWLAPTSPGTRTSSWSLVTLITQWPHRPLSPRHTMSRCHHLHICFNQHTRSTSSRINISDMRDYKWFESIKVMYSGEVVFIFPSFLMIFLFSPIPIPHPTKFSLRCLPNIMEDCFCQYQWIDINISQEKSYPIKDRYRTQHMTWTTD